MWFTHYVLAVLTTALSIAIAHKDKNPVDHYERNFNTVNSIYNLTVWPNNLPIIVNGGSAVPPGLFAQNATGRVSPVGNFTGFEESIEYFFALALVPSPPTYSVFSKATVVEFTSGCPEVAASVVYLETTVDNPNATNNGQFLSILKEVAFWHFDDTGAVTSYDAWIPNLQTWNFLSAGQDLSVPAVQAGVIQEICPLIQQRCVGSNQQYTDASQCLTDLSTKPFGDYDEAWGDNIVCRTIHVILALVDPIVHCPHVGPTGGGKCVNEPYNEGYFDDEALFGMPAGTTFTCPDKGQGSHRGYS